METLFLIVVIMSIAMGIAYLFPPIIELLMHIYWTVLFVALFMISVSVIITVFNSLTG